MRNINSRWRLTFRQKHSRLLNNDIWVWTWLSQHLTPWCQVLSRKFQLNLKINSATICHHHHHHISVMELGHLLTRSGLTYPEVSSEVCHDSFCQLGNSVSLPWVIYYGAFYLHVVSSFSCIPVICLKLVLFLIPLQFVHLFCNQSKCILFLFICNNT